MSSKGVAARVTPGGQGDECGLRPAKAKRFPRRPGIVRIDLTGNELAAGISLVAHDLRNSLASILSSAEVLAEDWDNLESAQARAMATSMHRRMLWLQGLVENMFSMSLAGKDGLSIQPRPTNLLDVVHEACCIVEPILAQKRQKLRVSAALDLPGFEADPIRLVQVLINLLLNASKYSGEASRISVQLSASATAVRVSILDRGIGLSRGEAERLFEAFYRAPVAASTDSDGVGLGLAIVRAVVEAHGGCVGAAPRQGGGAHFWFELPTVSKVDRLQTRAT